MKNSLILCLFVVITSGANAQLRKSISSERPSTLQNKTAEPFLNFYGKALNITLHKNGGEIIQHSLDQQVTFFKDGTLTSTLETELDKGTWTYDETTHQLTLTLTGEGSDQIEIYTIKEIQNTKIKLVNGEESLTLYILKKRDNAPIEILNDSEND